LSKFSASTRPGNVTGVPVNGVDPGGVVPLATVTVMEDEALLPAASNAVAVSVCAPFVAVRVSHAAEYGVETSSPRSCVLSTKNRTRVTPTLSDALALTVVGPEIVAPCAGDWMVTAGGVWSPDGGGGGSVPIE
jgi:hypothetical protein